MLCHKKQGLRALYLRNAAPVSHGRIDLLSGNNGARAAAWDTRADARADRDGDAAGQRGTISGC